MMWLGITIVCVLTVFGGLKLKRRWQRQRRKLERAAIEATMETIPGSPATGSPLQSVSSADTQAVPSVDSRSSNLSTETRSETKTPESVTSQTAIGAGSQQLDRLSETEHPNETEQITRDIVLQLADYQYLESLLADQRYEEADRVTWRLLLQLMGAEGRGYVELDEMEFLPTAELRHLDRLWQRYSQGHWGFTTQRRLLEGADGDYSDLGKKTGWMVDGTWLQKQNMVYDLDRSPAGHLPQEIWRNVFSAFDAFGLALGVETFLMQNAFDPTSQEPEDSLQDDTEESED